MNTRARINSLIDNKHINIFGYSTNGIPGIELVGLGGRSRSFKEKLNYTNKDMGIKLKCKRYVICVEIPEGLSINKMTHLSNLELPMLLLLWSLANVLPISNLENIWCQGRLLLNGLIIVDSKSCAETLDSKNIIISTKTEMTDDYNYLSLKEIFSPVLRKDIASKYKIVSNLNR